MKNLLFILAALSCNSGNGNHVQENDSIAQQPDTANNNLAAPVDTTTLEGTWYLVPVLPSDTAAGKIPVLNFAPATQRVTGNTGCNSLSGGYTKTDSTLGFDKNMITTKMACPGYNEPAFLESLINTNGYRFEDGELILMHNQTDLSHWSRKPVKGPKTNKI